MASKQQTNLNISHYFSAYPFNKQSYGNEISSLLTSSARSTFLNSNGLLLLLIQICGFRKGKIYTDWLIQMDRQEHFWAFWNRLSFMEISACDENVYLVSNHVLCDSNFAAQAPAAERLRPWQSFKSVCAVWKLEYAWGKGRSLPHARDARRRSRCIKEETRFQNRLVILARHSDFGSGRFSRVSVSDGAVWKHESAQNSILWQQDGVMLIRPHGLALN